MTGEQALEEIRGAFHRGRYFFDPHAKKRMEERGVSMHDVKFAAMHAATIDRYIDPERVPPTGVTSWRLTGIDLEREELHLGIDLAQDHMGSHVVVVTVF